MDQTYLVLKQLVQKLIEDKNETLAKLYGNVPAWARDSKSIQAFEIGFAQALDPIQAALKDLATKK